MKLLISFLSVLSFLQACATTELNAPTAPCASTERDCGPARPLNTGVALGPSAQVGMSG